MPLQAVRASPARPSEMTGRCPRTGALRYSGHAGRHLDDPDSRLRPRRAAPPADRPERARAGAGRALRAAGGEGADEAPLGREAAEEGLPGDPLEEEPRARERG